MPIKNGTHWRRMRRKKKKAYNRSGSIVTTGFDAENNQIGLSSWKFIVGSWGGDHWSGKARREGVERRGGGSARPVVQYVERRTKIVFREWFEKIDRRGKVQNGGHFRGHTVRESCVSTALSFLRNKTTSYLKFAASIFRFSHPLLFYFILLPFKLD